MCEKGWDEDAVKAGCARLNTLIEHRLIITSCWRWFITMKITIVIIILLAVAMVSAAAEWGRHDYISRMYGACRLCVSGCCCFLLSILFWQILFLMLYTFSYHFSCFSLYTR